MSISSTNEPRNGPVTWRDLNRVEKALDRLDADLDKKVEALNSKIDRLIYWLVGSVLTMAVTVGIFTLTLLTQGG